jgi:hypothetical protein
MDCQDTFWPKYKQQWSAPSTGPPGYRPFRALGAFGLGPHNQQKDLV